MEHRSIGLEGMLSFDWGYTGKEKYLKRLKNLHIKFDEYGSYRFFYIDNKTIIGCLQVQVIDNNQKQIASNIFVDENHRRKGIAGILIAKAYNLFPDMVFSTNRNNMSEGMVKKYLKIK